MNSLDLANKLPEGWTAQQFHAVSGSLIGTVERFQTGDNDLELVIPNRQKDESSKSATPKAEASSGETSKTTSENKVENKTTTQTQQTPASK